MEELVKEYNRVQFLIKFEGDLEYSANFSVFEVISWNVNGEPLETELYLTGCIKWDGCSHIYFGDEDGYMHLCGKGCFEKHKKVMDAIWEMCSKRIKNWDEDVAS